MEIYEESLTVGPAGLSTGDLFRALQKISGDHCRQIGYGEPVMEAKGLMWVIVRHGAWVKRYPAPGEELQTFVQKEYKELRDYMNEQETLEKDYDDLK